MFFFSPLILCPPLFLVEIFLQICFSSGRTKKVFDKKPCDKCFCINLFLLESLGYDTKTYYHLYIYRVHLSYYLFFSFSPELIKCAVLVCSAGSIPDTCINSGTDLKHVSVVEKRLFGVPLNTLLENDQKLLPNTKVPLLLQAVSFLDFIHASAPRSWEAFEACNKEGLTSHPLYLRAFFFPLLIAAILFGKERT